MNAGKSTSLLEASYNYRERGMKTFILTASLCYGLKTYFQGELFLGSQYLLGWADNLKELKTICHSGRKATVMLRLDADGQAIKKGAQVEIGGNESYGSICRKHFREALWD